jgi:hypothetical protein
VLKGGYPTMDDGNDKGSDKKQRHGDRAIASVLAWAATKAEGQPPAGASIDPPPDHALPEAMRERRRPTMGFRRADEMTLTRTKRASGSTLARCDAGGAGALKPTRARLTARRSTPTRRTGAAHRQPAARPAAHHAGAHAAIAHWLWEQNPLANWIIEIKVAFLLAEGVQPRSPTRRTRRRSTRFWRDPINEMAIKLPKKVRELAMFGEQLWPAFVNEIDGMVRLGYIDPKIIEHRGHRPGQPRAADRHRHEEGRQGPLLQIPRDDQRARERVHAEDAGDPRQVHRRRGVLLPRERSLGGTRGRSDLLPLADWLDVYDQFLFGEGERAKLLRALVWDLELKNATPRTVKKRAREFVLPGIGRRVRAQRLGDARAEDAEARGGDTSDGARMLRNHILGGARPARALVRRRRRRQPRGGDRDGRADLQAARHAPEVWKNILESLGRYVLMKKAAADGRARVDRLVRSEVERAGDLPRARLAPMSRSTRRRCSRSWSAARSRSTRASCRRRPRCSSSPPWRRAGSRSTREELAKARRRDRRRSAAAAAARRSSPHQVRHLVCAEVRVGRRIVS